MRYYAEVLCLSSAVLSVSKEVLMASITVLPSPTGVLPNPEGVLLMPKKCCLIKTAQSIHRICKSKCKTAVLVAIAIPVFTTQLEKSREATDVANVRSAYAYVMTEYLTNADTSYSMQVTAKQTQSGWAMGASAAVLMAQVDGKESAVPITNHIAPSGKFTVKITKSGTVSVN